jgi:uridine kinase
VAQDNYYRSAEYLTNRTITDFNFDHPDAFDTDLLFEQLQTLKSGQPIRMPQYDFVHHRRRDDTVLVEPRKLVIFEGIMIYFDKRVRDLIDLKLYVDTPDDIRFIRRLRRDITERGRTMESVIAQYMEKVRPRHYEFVEPTKAMRISSSLRAGLTSGPWRRSFRSSGRLRDSAKDHAHWAVVRARHLREDERFGQRRPQQLRDDDIVDSPPYVALSGPHGEVPPRVVASLRMQLAERVDEPSLEDGEKAGPFLVSESVGMVIFLWTGEVYFLMGYVDVTAKENRLLKLQSLEEAQERAVPPAAIRKP